MSLHIENAQIYLKEELLLNIDDWSLEDGVLYGLTGETGSGKSTLARWIATVEPAYWKAVYDTLRFEFSKDQADVQSKTDQAHSGSVEPLYLLQDAYQIFNPYVSLYNHFRDVWKNNSSRSSLNNFDQIFNILSEIGIADPEVILRRKVHQISQGEAQRAAFVLSLIRPSSILILDEFISNVDKDASNRMLRFAQKWCVIANIPGLVISHDVPLVRTYADEVFHLDNRRLNPVTTFPESSFRARTVIDSLPLIEGHDVSISLPGKHDSRENGLIHLEHFRIGSMECVGVSGRSGVGKTTFLRGLLGETSLEWGSLYIRGKEVGAGKRNELGSLDIRYLPQSVVSSFNPAFNLKTSLQELKSVHDANDADLNRLFNVFKISPSLIHKYPNELSGGEIQRMGIISVLLGRPDLILLDESFSSVDTKTRQSIWSALMIEQREMSFSLIVASHDQNWLENHMNRWYEFKDRNI